MVTVTNMILTKNIASLPHYQEGINVGNEMLLLFSSLVPFPHTTNNIYFNWWQKAQRSFIQNLFFSSKSFCKVVFVLKEVNSCQNQEKLVFFCLLNYSKK